MLKICFRVDGDSFIGSGHIFRCFNFANYINNAEIEFICKNISKNLIDLIQSKFKLNFLEKNINLKITKDKNSWLNDNEIDDVKKTINIVKTKKFDWIIIDHYGISSIWETEIKKYIKNIFVIDDYVNRKHNCSYILNNLLNNKGDYNGYLNDDCKILNGKEYIILDKIYLNDFIVNDNKLKTINVFMGGVDKENETLKIIKKCNEINKNLNYDLNFDVIIGPGNPNYNSICKFCNNNNNFTIFYNLKNMKNIFLKSDLCIGSAGITVFERCLLQVPSLLVCFDENQRVVLDGFISAGVTEYIGTVKDNYLEKLEKFIFEYYNDENKLKTMQKKCYKYFNRNDLLNFSKNINNIFI